MSKRDRDREREREREGEREREKERKEEREPQMVQYANPVCPWTDLSLTTSQLSS